LISLNNQAKQLSIEQLLFEKEKSDNKSSLFKACLISILQKSRYYCPVADHRQGDVSNFSSATIAKSSGDFGINHRHKYYCARAGYVTQECIFQLECPSKVT